MAKIQLDRRTKTWWSQKENVITFINELGDKLGFKNPDDWYKITLKNLTTNGGVGLLNLHHKSHADMVMTHITRGDGREWEAWRFNAVPMKWWDVPKNQVSFMKYLAGKLNFTSPEDWYQINANTLKQHNGSRLLQKYNDSPKEVVMHIMQNHKWEAEKFVRTNNKWYSTSLRRQYLDKLGQMLGFTKMEDWYQVKAQHFREYDGGQLLHLYSNPATCVMELYNTHNWMPWKFYNLPVRMLSEAPVLRKFFAYLAKELNISALDEWYTVSNEVIALFAPTKVIAKGLPFSLQRAFPEHNWDAVKFDPNSRAATVRLLGLLLHKHVPNANCKENYHHLDLTHLKIGVSLVTDFYFPSLRLAIEYIGEYQGNPLLASKLGFVSFGDTGVVSQHYEFKRVKFSEAGITLVQVPLSWDKRPESLEYMIQDTRMDISFVYHSKAPL